MGNRRLETQSQAFLKTLTETDSDQSLFPYTNRPIRRHEFDPAENILPRDLVQNPGRPLVCLLPGILRSEN